jgi:hypothetical protein
MLQLLSTVLLIAAGAPFALPGLVLLLGVFWWLYGYFMASMRQAKRIESVSRCGLWGLGSVFWGFVCAFVRCFLEVFSFPV